MEKSSFDVVRKTVDNVLIEAHREMLQIECAKYRTKTNKQKSIFLPKQSYLERSTVAATGNEPAGEYQREYTFCVYEFVCF
jgi:hypothetical protein